MTNNTFTIIDHDNDNEQTANSRSEAEDMAATARQLGSDNVEIIPPDNAEPDGGHAEVVDTPAQDPRETTAINPSELSKNPISFLKSVNSDFVNSIKGKQAISKQGFRFIQREFEITTQSEVVKVIDDPLGVIVWARAELNDEYAAEAHGEGWQFETDVDDNELVRYADTRAQNRALSDLTSAGALAVSELQNEPEGQ